MELCNAGLATMANEVFEGQVALLVRVLLYVATEACFALKGGTAINLFVRDLPRLSVDIDLVYLPIEDRETSLIGMRSALSRIALEIRKAIPERQRLIRPNGLTRGFSEINLWRMRAFFPDTRKRFFQRRRKNLEHRHTHERQVKLYLDQ